MSLDTDKKASDIVKRIKIKEPSYVVGVGASAGGLNAIKQLLRHFPTDLDVAIIIVQHLSPDYKTLMDELLMDHTDMPVKLATDCEYIEANTVYVLPERKHLLIGSNKIMLSDIDESKRHHTIDQFFKSLAEERQNEAIGIVLSGTGNDGTRGIIELDAVGALTIAQNPDEAEYASMPQNAINTQVVSRILNVGEMGEEIASYIKTVKEYRDNSPIKSSDQQFDFRDIIKFVNDQCQFDLANYKVSTIQRRIQHRMGILGISDFDAYVALCSRRSEEVEALARDIMIGITSFFRDEQVWEALYEDVICPLVEKAEPDYLIRIWVPGCSTGEEAYTMSILVHEALEKFEKDNEVRIFASDVDRRAIRKAGFGKYSNNITSDVPEAYLNKYFRLSQGGYLVSEKIRKSVVFALHDLINDPPFSNMDIISCRNVLIYFQAEAQREILSLMHFALRSSGHLLLGEAETTSPLKDYFFRVSNEGHIYKRTKNSKVSLSKVQQNRKPITLATTKSRADFKRVLPPENMVEYTVPKFKELLFKCFVPATLVLDNLDQVVYSFGNTEQFTRKLTPGLHNLHYSSCVIEPLVNIIGSALNQMDENKKRIILDEIVIDSEPENLYALDAQLYTNKKHRIENFKLIAIYPMSVASSDDDGELSQRASTFSKEQVNMRMQQLDDALSDARLMLGEKQQNLDELSEELQVTNEELMAANEELQSTNEELQSVNEELFTVNSEHQEKIEQLETANHDLDILLNATEVGIIYLDKHLLIKRFTAKVKDYVNILPLDINRPVTDLTQRFTNIKLEDVITKALSENAKQEVMIDELDNTSSKSRLIVSPCTMSNSRIEGVVIVFQDLG